MMTKELKKKKSKHSNDRSGHGFHLAKNHSWIMGLIAVTFIVFIPAIRNGFVTFDDPHYVYDNPYIKNLTSENLKAILFTDANNLGNYHPVTLLSYAINYTFSELNPTSYHFVNILLHLLNTFLVFQLAMSLFIRIGTERRQLLSFITALLFGIHPLHVESVAWVSGRKDLLYTCFYLLSLLAYIRYLDGKRLSGYLLSLLFFLLSLLSKGMAVTLPLALVATDYLLKRELKDKKLIAEKVPFFVLSLAFGILAVVVQQAQGATAIIKFGFFERLVFASYGFTQYLIKFIVPYNLCGYYPYPSLSEAIIPGAWYLSLIPAVLSGMLLIWFLWVRPNRKIVFGILFFVINVIFVLQLFPVGSAVMADRYTYLSSFGLFFLLAAGVGFLLQQYPSARWAIIAVFMLYATVLFAGTIRRIPVWKDSYSFWSDVMLKHPNFYPALNNLGELYEDEGKTREAFQLFSNSIKVQEVNPNAYFRRGTMSGKSGRYSEAISDLSKAIRYMPGFKQAYTNRAIAKSMNSDYRGALADLDTVIVLGGNESAYYNRGVLKNELKEFSQAVPDFLESIRINPACARCYYSLGLAYYHAGMYPESINSFSSCVGLDPAYGYAYYYRALSLIGSTNPDHSCADLRKAAALGIKEADTVLKKFCGR